MLSELDFYNVWVQQGVGNFDVFISCFKQHLTDTFIQNWRARLEQSSRANFYKSLAVFELQPYLDNVNLYKLCNALIKLWVSAHRLEVESGRWVKPYPIHFNERHCLNHSVLQDEYHFVLVCPLFLDLRKKYISKYYWSRPSMLKFIELLNASNTSCIRKLCCYVHAFKQRTDLLYTGRNRN